MRFTKMILTVALIAASSLVATSAFATDCPHKKDVGMFASTNPPAPQTQGTASTQPASPSDSRSTYGKH